MGIDSVTEQRWAEEDSAGEDERSYIIPTNIVDEGAEKLKQEGLFQVRLLEVALHALRTRLRKGDHPEDAWAEAMVVIDAYNQEWEDQING